MSLTCKPLGAEATRARVLAPRNAPRWHHRGDSLRTSCSQVPSPSDYGTLPRPTTPLTPIHGGVGGRGVGGGGSSGSGTAPPQESQGMCDGNTRLHRRHIAHPVAHNQVVSLPVHARDELDPAGRVEDEALWLGLGLG